MTTKMHCVILDRILDQEKKTIKDNTETMGKSDDGLHIRCWPFITVKPSECDNYIMVM